MSQQAERLKSLKVKRGNIKAQMTRFRTFLNGPDQLIHNIQVRYNQAEKLLDKFEEYQSEIEELDASEDQSNERIAFENAYFDTLGLANQIIKNNSDGQGQSSAASSSSRTSDNISGTQTAQQVKLPSINLPTFSGLYDEWLNFYEMFKTLVDENESLSGIQRFNYLRSSLKGDASQVIASLQLSAANYKTAWDLLSERYNNKRAIINKHITALFELPAVTKESHTSIRHLIDELNKHLRALKTLDAPTDSWDLLINHLILTKLDYTTKREWELSQTGSSSATLEEMKAFLLSRAQAYENIRQPQTIKQTNTNKTNSSNKQFIQTKAYLSFEQPKCQLCKEKHALYKCKKLLDLSIADRISQLKRLRVCYNCLKSNHVSQDCTAGKCRVCNKNHNTLIHSDEIPQAKSTHSDEEKEGSVTTHAATNSQVLLATALVYVIDKQGKAHEFRAMLDSGSQSNFITKRLCNKLNLQCQPFNMPVIGISQVQTTIKQRADVTIKSRVNGFKEELSCLVLPEITGILPNKQVIKEELNIPDHIILADPNFHIPKTIDLLIGSSIFWKLICVGQFKVANGHSTVQKTQLGWIIAGPIAQNKTKGTEHTVCNLNLEHSVENFWKVEEYEEHTKVLSEEEKRCEEHFTKTTTINENGKFVVSLPLRESVITLGESKTEALQRLHSIERKCKRNPQLRVEYSKFMQEYLDLGHMVEVSSSNIPEQVYYLPHHAIQRKESETTKLRVVFDASSKTTTGLSLNDTMMIGPTIQETLFSIVTRFRSYEYAVTADIAKMYRQIYITEEEQDLQRILWRFNDEDEVKEYKLTTVTYGTAAAPYLAVRCLQEVANQAQQTDSIAADAISKNFYVDDFIAGADSTEEAIELAQKVSNLLNARGFPLRKWASNNKEILQALLQSNESNSSDVYISDKSEQKTLGLIWNTESDTLQYKVDMKTIPMKVTKRTLLGVIAQVFDPLGLVGPATIKPKLILQQLWQAGVSWDESLPMHLYTTWRNTHEKLHHLNELKIPRNVMTNKCINLQLHGFADASEKAYGASIYCRTYNAEGSVNVNLIAAKARIAPLKAITLPRLELSAAVLLAKLMNSVIKSIQIQIDNVSYWTDSTITLSWIVGQPNQWKTFVGNRVATIQRLTNVEQWYHVSSNENPADQDRQ